ncbi:hypothetical protein GXP67_04730 [Rhodocytophaga rosea]|uniref:Uncharacterized protein n=1 Tax=Rhodocytophaga rosea TaxID=2704465 RepID=A0A6C0GDI5_9BACT|nr:DUF5908 family protein [Rhodocytophaga rosea]QHT66026.1 hypothetical protein GXP67_04730 [Rhodocytophaga rosea]
MPIEIKELVVRIIVQDKSHPQIHDPNRMPAISVREIVEECVEKVMEKLEAKLER